MKRVSRTPRIRPLRAAVAVARLVRDPDATDEVFHLYESLIGGAIRRYVRRMRRTRVGARVLDQRRPILPILQDRAGLCDHPSGSLARAYARWAEAEGIDADGLVEASNIGPAQYGVGTDERFFLDNLRDTHDLWHVVTGYHRDVIGEASLVAFGAAQMPHLGGLVLMGTGLLVSRDMPGARRLIAEGWRRGRAAAWLPGQDWIARLAQPLEQVRAELCVGAPPVYEPVWSPGYQAQLAT